MNLWDPFFFYSVKSDICLSVYSEMIPLYLQQQIRTLYNNVTNKSLIQYVFNFLRTKICKNHFHFLGIPFFQFIFVRFPLDISSFFLSQIAAWLNTSCLLHVCDPTLEVVSTFRSGRGRLYCLFWPSSSFILLMFY